MKEFVKFVNNFKESWQGKYSNPQSLLHIQVGTADRIVNEYTKLEFENKQQGEQIRQLKEDKNELLNLSLELRGDNARLKEQYKQAIKDGRVL